MIWAGAVLARTSEVYRGVQEEGGTYHASLLRPHHAGHVVVQAGLYSLVRHPSYTGLLIAFLGLGVFFANWLSILSLLIPITLAVLNRVVKEEHALLASLGAEYAAYCARTKRFIPGLL